MKKSFTLIETIVVIGVIAIIIPAVFSIIFPLISGQSKIYHLVQAKREGDYALGIMENIIRNNGTFIYSGCSNLSALTSTVCASNAPSFPANYSSSSNATDFCFLDKNSAGFQFKYDTTALKIASSSSSLGTVYLTSDKVAISGFNMSCVRTAPFSPPVVTIGFDICYNVPGGGCNLSQPGETLHYQTNIQLRSY